VVVSYPTIVVIATIVAILVLMAFDSDEQQAIFLATISAAFIVGAGVLAHRHRNHESSTAR
jgi:GABA permease